MNEIMVLICTAVSTLFDLPGHGAPESSFYMALCNMDMTKWTLLRNVLLSANLVTIKGNWVELTDKGRTVAHELDVAILNPSATGKKEIVH